MADDVTVGNTTGQPNDYIVSADEAASGKVQRVKLALSADGSDTLILADANGLEVQLGASLPAGTANIGDVDVLTMPTVTVNAHAVTNAGTFAVQESGAALTSLQLLDDTVATDGSAVLTKGLQIAGTDGTNAQVLKVDSTGSLQVDIESMPAVTVTGVATEATLASLLTSSQLVDDSVSTTGSAVPAKGIQATGTDGTNARALKTDSAGELQIDVLTLPALVAGTANIGDVDVLTLPSIPAGTNNIGDVDVLTVIPGVGATSLGKAEDAVAASGDTGVMALAVRNDGGATLVNADGDYGALQLDSNGQLRVGISAAFSTIAVSSIVGGTGATSLGKAEDGGHTTGDTGVMALAVRRDSPIVGSGTDGDYSTLNVDGNGALYVTGAGGGTQYNIDSVASATATGTVALVVRKDAGGTLAGTDGDISGLQVDASGSLRVTGGGGGTEYTEDVASPADPVGSAQMLVRDDATGSIVTTDGDWIAARSNVNGAQWVAVDGTVGLAAGTNNIGDVDVLSLPALAAGTNNIGDVDVLTMPTVTIAAIPAGTNNIGDVDVLTLPALPAGNNNIGDVDIASSVTLTVNTHDVGSITTAIVPGVAATNLGKREDDAHTSLDTGVFALAVRHDTATTGLGADGDYAALSVGSDGRLQVNVGNTVTVAAHAVTNAGTFVTQENGAALTAMQLLDDTIVADDAAFTVATTKVTMAGFLADEASTDSVDEGDAGAARMTLDRRAISVTQPHTQGGLTLSSTISAASTNATSVKASIGQVYTIMATNLNAAVRYLKLYNKASAPTVGTDVPVLRFAIPGNTAGAGFVIDTGGMGFAFATGIAFALTTGVADADTGAVAANEIVVNLGYR